MANLCPYFPKPLGPYSKLCCYVLILVGDILLCLLNPQVLLLSLLQELGHALSTCMVSRLSIVQIIYLHVCDMFYLDLSERIVLLSEDGLLLSLLLFFDDISPWMDLIFKKLIIIITRVFKRSPKILRSQSTKCTCS